MKKGILLFQIITGITLLAANDISVSDVELAQDSKSRLVTVSYTLTGDPAIVTVDFLTNGVSIGEANFSNVSGDVNKLVSDTQSLKERRCARLPISLREGLRRSNRFQRPRLTSF